MKQFTNAEFAALNTEQRAELRYKFCVYNDGSQRFKDTVIRFLDINLSNPLTGCLLEYYHFPRTRGFVCHIQADHPILTIDQFCELFPDYSDVKKVEPQLSSEQIEAIAKSVVTMIASGNTIKGSDGNEYQVTMVEEAKNEHEGLIGKWLRYWLIKHENREYFNRWYKIDSVELKSVEENNDGNEQNLYITIEGEDDEYRNEVWKGIDNSSCRFDLNNPLDYNPETLVGKYYEGMKIQSLGEHNETKLPLFYLGGENFVACKDITPLEVTDAPPTKSLKWGELPTRDRTISEDVQLDAFKKLQDVMKAANGDWVAGESENVYVPQWFRATKSFSVCEWQSHTPLIHFRTREDAEQALKDNEQLFKDFYGVE